jgi:hypothetical protein
MSAPEKIRQKQGDGRYALKRLKGKDGKHKVLVAENVRGETMTEARKKEDMHIKCRLKKGKR